MQLGLKISGVEVAFLLALRRGYSLNYSYSFPHWRNKMQISMHGAFDLCTSGVRKTLNVGVQIISNWCTSGVQAEAGKFVSCKKTCI